MQAGSGISALGGVLAGRSGVEMKSGKEYAAPWRRLSCTWQTRSAFTVTQVSYRSGR